MIRYEDDPGWQYLKLPAEKLTELQTKPYDSKKNCWIPDEEEGYIAAEIKSAKGDQVTLTTAKGAEKTIKKDLVQDMNPPKFEMTEDMSNLTMLNDASVLHNLRHRYSQMLIYTYSGLFCVVINPYKRLPIYTDSVAQMYMGKRRNEMPPHLFAVSDEAYRYMLQDRENQSMLITGESGAGKTENTKKVIAYFASVGASQQKAAPAAASDEKKVTLEDQIVRTNPVLEAFGNARTVRNNNSSRFGKFIRIHFSKDGKVADLLEKSRVVRQAPGERCYHIFYQLMSGQIPNLTKELLLDRPLKDYWFVAQAELTIDGVDDKEEMQMTDECFDILGFPPEDKTSILKICAFIMHMGCMKFKQRPREEQAEPDETAEAEKAAKCVGVNHEEFLKAFCKPRVKVGTEWVNKGQNLEQVTWGMGAMAKGFYARLFDVLVQRCNKTLDAKDLPREYFIGVLDIAGFEIFDMNSFEQLWINFVNERLQQFFNHHMFVLEQEEYQREGIHWEFIDFGLDLAACIELIEKPLGVISVLDEECIVPKATDMTLNQKLHDQHLGKHPNFQKPKPPKGKQAEAHFAIVHYAGVVRYNVINWLEKNKDPLNDTVVSVLKTTSDAVIQETWAAYTTQEEAAKKAKEGGGGKKKGKSGSFMTVSMLYRESLSKLMTMLNATHPHFIRCIIPNEKKKCGLIDAGLCLNQLTCNGVLEGIRICRKGFPNRLLHADFKQRYSILGAEAAKSSPDPKVCADGILSALVKEGGLMDEQFRVGSTKVFFKAGTLAQLEDMRDEKLSQVLTGLQSKIRWFLGGKEKKRRLEQRTGIVVVQRNIRSWCTLRNWEWFKLFGKVKPLLKAGKASEEMEKVADKMKELEDNLSKEEKLRKDLEESNTKLTTEKNDIFLQLEAERTSLAEAESRIQKLTSQKTDLEKQLNDHGEKLTDQEDRNAELQKAKKKVESEIEALKKNIQDLELALRKAESEKQSKDSQNRSLQDEMAQQDEVIAKLNKEKKHQEEVNRKLTDDLQGEEDKVNHLNKVKGKLEQNLDELEDALEREKRQRQEVEKQKRKLEGELKVALENSDETNKQKQDSESSLKKKEQEMHSLASRLEDEQSLVGKLQRQIKELQARIQELEEELESERQSRSKSDRVKSELQRELEELAERLEEAGGATAAQIEMNKKRDAELARLRRDLEASGMNHENQLGALRKKHNDAVAEMGDQMDVIQKQKAKLEKDKVALAREVEDSNAALDSESKSKQNFEKMAKQLEIQVSELQIKCDEQSRQLADFTSIKGRLHGENSDLARQLEDAEAQLSAVSRIKSQLNSQLEEAKRTADDEARERQTYAAEVRNYQHEVETLRDQIEEEQEGKSEVMRQLSKANAEIQQWRAKFESEGLARAEELEESKRKLTNKVNDMQENIEAAHAKIMSLEKTRSKLMGDLDDAQVDVERAQSYAAQLEKRQKGFDKVVDDWRRKTDDLSAELDASQRECRNLSTDVFKLRNSNEEMQDQLESLRRENKTLAVEIKDLTDQLGEGGRSVHEMQKMVRRLEMEKEELQHALDEAEAALEAEEAKVLRAQIEVSQIRQEIEKRIHEKEEEFENTRKNHQRALDSMQASLESEAKGRAELLRLKKKLESDINELEIALDHANKANADAQKNLKRYQEQIKELQMQIEEEQRERDVVREQYSNSEKRCSLLQAEKEELMGSLESTKRAQRAAELEATEHRETVNDLTAQNTSLNGMKRKLESEMQALHTDLDDTLNELKACDDQAKKAMADSARLADELRQEQEHSHHVERMRKGLEQTIKELQVRLDEAEQAAAKGGKKVIAKLEARLRQLEGELDTEQRKMADASKNIGRADRRIHELQFQVEEDKKNQDRLQDLIDKLQSKIKTYKRQVEEAEEIANGNLSKYRQIQHQLDDAEERADMAENSLSKLRAKNRSSATAGPLAVSASSAAILHSPTRGGRATASAVNFTDLGIHH